MVYPRVQLRIDNRVIIDSRDFMSEVEGSILSFKLQDSDAFPSVVDAELVAIGGWKLNSVSLIHSKASSDMVVNGWKSLENLIPMDKLLIPFLYNTAIDYVRFSISHVEPKWATLLRLCYWYERCLRLNDGKFHYKQTEIKRAIMKPLRNTEKTLNEKGRGFLPAMEQLNKAISSYTSELEFAILTNECGSKVSFDKKHDFVSEALPCEVKSVYSHMTIEKGEDGTSKMNIHGQVLGEKVNPSEEFFKFVFSRKILKHLSKAYYQGGKLAFLDASHSYASILMYLLSTNQGVELTFCKALNNAIQMAKSTKGKLPVVIASSTPSYEHQIIALVVPMPFELFKQLERQK